MVMVQIRTFDGDHSKSQSRKYHRIPVFTVFTQTPTPVSYKYLPKIPETYRAAILFNPYPANVENMVSF